MSAKLIVRKGPTFQTGSAPRAEIIDVVDDPDDAASVIAEYVDHNGDKDAEWYLVDAQALYIDFAVKDINTDEPI